MLKSDTKTSRVASIDFLAPRFVASGKAECICLACGNKFITKPEGKTTRITCSGVCRNKLRFRIRQKRVDPNRLCAIDGCGKKPHEWSRLCTTHAGRRNRAREPLRSMWTGMKQRCYNPNNSKFDLYGGRGIAVCDRWRNDFQQFKKDIGPKPSPKHSIDRIDNDGDYSPENCRWATQLQQHMNRRLHSKNKTGHRGVCSSSKKPRLPWRAYVHFQGKQIHLGYFQTVDEAIRARKQAEIKYYGKPNLV